MRVVVLFVSCASIAACEDSRDRTGAPPRARSDAGTNTSDDAGPDDRGLSNDDARVEPTDGAIDERDADLTQDDARTFDDADTNADATGFPDATTPTLPLCLSVCSVPGDCVSSPTAITDSDNYTCPQGRCNYLGCNNTTECQTTFNSSDYVCVLIPSYPLPSCLKICSTASDCAVAGSPLFGTDNYRCTNGGCEWIGCSDTQECRDTFQDNSYVCELQPAGNPNFKNCIKPCATPSDCGSPSSPAYDADNYDCTNQRCIYLGCNSTAECTASFPSGSYVCE